jgi:hypothetical protein
MAAVAASCWAWRTVAGTAPADRLPGGVGRRRTRRQSSGAAPTGLPRCLVPRRCPARRGRAPGTVPGRRPVVGPVGPAARRSAPARTPTHRPPTPAAPPGGAAVPG